MVKFRSQSLGCTLVYERDERVAYAYLLEGGQIRSDVWLYNRTDVTDISEWVIAGSVPPFVNSARYAGVSHLAAEQFEEAMVVSWSIEAGRPVASIVVAGVLWARLATGDRPGACCLARSDGPLARCLTPAPTSGATDDEPQGVA